MSIGPAANLARIGCELAANWPSKANLPVDNVWRECISSRMLKRTTIWLTQEQVKRLRVVATRKGLKAAQLIRLYVDAGLSKEKKH